MTVNTKPMTIRDARFHLARRLQFGDPAQIEALQIIALRDELEQLACDRSMYPICSRPGCWCKSGRSHGILDKWDAEILKAQIARIRDLTEDDAPCLTEKQWMALSRA